MKAPSPNLWNAREFPERWAFVISTALVVTTLETRSILSIKDEVTWVLGTRLRDLSGSHSELTAMREPLVLPVLQ